MMGVIKSFNLKSDKKKYMIHFAASFKHLIYSANFTGDLFYVFTEHCQEETIDTILSI